jgi:hypothetical protein
MFEVKKVISDYLPNGWKIINPGAPSKFEVSKLRLYHFLKKDELSIDIEEMRRRAKKVNANLGLEDGDRMLNEQNSINHSFKDYYIPLPAVDLYGSRGGRDILCLGYSKGRWMPVFGKLNGIWRRGVRFVCVR